MVYFRLLQHLWRYAKGKRHILISFYILSALAQVAYLLRPYLLSKTVDVLASPQLDMLEQITYWLIWYVAATLLTWIFHGPARLMEKGLAIDIKNRFNDSLYSILKELPLPWHQNHHSGNTIHRIAKASSGLKNFSANQFIFIQHAMTFIGTIGLLYFIDFKMGMLMVAITSLLFVVLILFDRVIIPLYEKIYQKEHHAAEALHDYITNMGTILTLRLGEKTRRELWMRNQNTVVDHRKETRLNELKWFCTSFSQSIILAVLMIYYVWSRQHAQQIVALGSFVMLFQYLQRLSEVFYGFASRYADLIESDTRLREIKPILQDHATYNARGELMLHLEEKLPQVWQKLEISDLNFAYEDRQHHHHRLQNIRLELHRGEKVALVGASGAGKSTLLSLMRGLYKASGAQVKLDGAIHDLAVLAEYTTLIPQEPEIFENTIAYNVTVGVHYTQEELHEAMRIACFDNVARALPKEIETDVREKGVNLSGGQKQRLALARGIFAAKESSLILLDEPTSSVDSLTETKIYQNIFAAFPQAAIVSSIHRLHLLDLFDSVYVMEDGKILEHGKLEELIARQGFFYHLWTAYLRGTTTTEGEG